jgi:PAS domain S-box-containing protein
MNDNGKTKAQLIKELGEIRRQVAESKAQEAYHRQSNEEALIKSEDIYRALVENLNVGIYRNTGGSHGHFIQANSALAIMFGYASVAEFMKVPVSDLYHDPEDRRRYMEELLRSGSVKEKEFRLKKKDGVLIWTVVSANVHYDEEGNMDWIDGIIEDISERKQKDAVLKESEEKYNQFFKTSRDCVFITSNDGMIIDMNDAAVELFGYSNREELMQVKVPYVYADPEEREEHISIIAQHGFTKEFPVDMRRKDGAVIHTLITSVARYDAEGNVIGFQGTIRDITERKRMEDDLRESEKHYRSVIENIQDVFYRADREGIIIMASPSFTQLLRDGSAQECLGKSIAAEFYYEPEKRKEFLAAISKRGYVEDYEVVLKRGDGTQVVVSTNSHFYYDQEGHVAGIEGTIRDISERKQAESIMRARLRLLEFAQSHSMNEFLTAALDEIEALTGSTIGFYHFLEPDQKTLFMQIWSTNTQKNMCTTEGKGSHYDIALAGVWVDCIHERRPVIHNDYASLPHRKGVPNGHAPVVREVVVPIFRGNLIKAVIGIGNKSTNYDENDIAIVSQLGDLSWDIIERKRAEEQLSLYAGELEEANTALRVFMNRHDQDQKALEDKLQLNINDLVIPYLKKLDQANLDSRHKNYLDVLENNLNNIVSPFMLNLSATYKNLTPQEIQIANLIRQGKNTKEIADLLCTSVHTIGTHRNNIRKKLKLRNAKANLRSFLLSLQ